MSDYSADSHGFGSRVHVDGDVWHEEAAAEGSVAKPVGGLRRAWRKISGHRSVLITDAKRTPYENLRHRERVYAWLQGARVPFLLASGATYMWWQNWIVSALLFAISVPLPWIAVVIANGHGEPRDKRAPKVYKPAVARFEVEQAQAAQALQAGSGAANTGTTDPSASDSAEVIDADQEPAQDAAAGAHTGEESQRK